jgi:Aspartyl protease
MKTQFYARSRTARLVSLVGSCLAGACLTQAATEKHLSPAPVATIKLEPYLAAQAIVHAVVEGHEGKFLFDTGEGVSSISPDFAKKIGCEPWGQITGFRMSGERLDSPHCDNITFKLGEQSFNAPVVMVYDIMKLMGPDVPAIDGAIGLDLFANRVLTIVPRQKIIIENRGSLEKRISGAKEIPIRIVRDAEGASLAVDAAVQTPRGIAWMELDGGNGGSSVIATISRRYLASVQTSPPRK